MLARTNPRSVGEFQAWFRTDADCLDYVEWLRWPAGFSCAGCGHDGGWRLSDGRFKCSGCSGRTSVTAGTIFDRSRTPLTVWFNACWLFATGKDGISALSLKRTLEIGSYQIAWALLHRLRSVLVRPGRDRLAGMVETDETYIGGEESGLPGGRARGKIGGFDRHRGGDPGAERVRPLPDAASGRRVGRLAAPLRDRSRRAGRDDHHRRLAGLPRAGETRLRPRPPQPAGGPGPRREDPGELLLPVVHRVASLAKRWLLGTHQGSVDDAHLASYLNEFVFRFNRRRSRSRGMVFYRVLELAVAHDPVRYQDLIATKRPRAVLPTPPLPGSQARGHPPSLERPPANRPWRTTGLDSSG